MNIDPVALAPAVTALSQGVDTSSATKPDFEAWLSSQVQQSNQQILDADTQLRKLALGEAQSLPQVMMSLEKAKLSFNLVVNVQNKVLQAYQDIMRMQV